MPSGPRYGPGMGMGIEVQAAPSAKTKSSVFPRAAGDYLTVDVIQQSETLTIVQVKGIMDDVPSSALLSASYTLQLAQKSRFLDLSVNATVLPCPAAVCGNVSHVYNVTSMRFGSYFASRSGILSFSDGTSMEDMDHEETPYFGIDIPVSRFSTVGEGEEGSVDLFVRASSLSARGAVVNSSEAGRVLVSATPFFMYAGRWNGARTGFGNVWAGVLATESWTTGWTGRYEAPEATVSAGTRFSFAISLAPNDGNFPIGNVPSIDPATSPAVAADTMATALLGSYAGPVGSLLSHHFAPEARIVPCVIRRGASCYMADGGFQGCFYDPDSFLSLAALSYSFDESLWAQAKVVVDTTRGSMCRQDYPGLCSRGQLPHHLVPKCGSKDPTCACRNNSVFPSVQDCASYTALSGALQTGPSVFWTLSALQVAAVSGDGDWLREILPDMRLVLEYLLGQFDAEVGLLKVTGSLFIDTFRRGNYTTDSNAALVYLLGEFADAERFVGNATGATQLEALASTVATAMNDRLWAPQSLGGDHYVTQANPDGSIRDFVDYDANTLALMAGVPSPDRAKALLARVDSGPCTHSRGTYVSEVYYDPANCFSNNDGDSRVAMGRIAWTDARARLVASDANTALLSILAPLKQELFANTWMHERYQCGAQPAHNPYYIEYAEVTAMIEMEVRLGMHFRPTSLTVAPIDPTFHFSLQIGPLAIARTQTAVSLTLSSWTGTRNITLAGLTPGAWTVKVAPNGGNGCQGGSFEVGSDGILQFCAPFGKQQAFSATLNHA